MIDLPNNSIDRSRSVPERITTGSLVRLETVGEASEWEVTLVSSDQADPDADLISDQCPIGEALLGRRPGDVVVVEAPLGKMRYRVISVSQPAAVSDLTS